MEISPLQNHIASPVATPPEQTPEQKAENRELIRAVKALNETEMFGSRNELTFVFDRETGRPLVRIIDRETKEVIQQIPPEYALRMAQELTCRL